MFTDNEIAFLRWHGIDPDGVYDGRWQSKDERHDGAKAEGKFLVLSSVPCRAAAHRLRTRAGHCFQCDPLKLVYQVRYSTPGYVYVAGSLNGRVIKIGTARDIPQRERQLRAEGYAGFSDWCVLFSVWANEAGQVETDASSRVPGQRIYRNYWKDGVQQTAIEALRCTFSDAVKAVKGSLGPNDVAEPWKARWTYPYEFDYSSPE